MQKRLMGMTAKEYNQIVHAHADGLYRFILKNLSDDDGAKDIVQDAFEKLWLNRGNINYTKAKAYLFTTGYHKMIDYIRKYKRLSLVEEHNEDAFYYSEAYEGTAESLESGLALLPAVQKSVVLLCDYEGYSYSEIGEITGLNEVQVKVYIHRARKFLRAFIQKMEGYYHD